jgi:hypothetical protein
MITAYIDDREKMRYRTSRFIALNNGSTIVEHRGFPTIEERDSYAASLEAKA